MNHTKILFRLASSLILLFLIGCTTIKYYPVNFVESLKHPTKFPDVYSSTVQNIEEVANKNPLREDEDIKITDVGENKTSSMHLIQVRENCEMYLHYHKRHDEVIYVKKGSGIATLDGTRYIVKPGSILQVPSKTVHKLLNTGNEVFVAVSVITPQYDGRDEKMIKEKKMMDRGVKEERRLAGKGSEGSKEGNASSANANKESDENKIGNVNKPNKVAEKIIEETDDTNTDIKNDKLKTKDSSKPKKTKTDFVSEEQPVNIEELHDKLTKLTQLKEEGAISEDEYEEKKDALVKGQDIGILPETKVKYNNEIPTEMEETEIESTSENVAGYEEHSSGTEAFDSTSENIQESTSDFSEETSLVADKEAILSEETTVDEDKLKMLEEMRQDGLITEEDYESKKEAIIKEEETDDTLKSSEPTDFSKGLTTEEPSSEEKSKMLEEMRDEGLITDKDYEIKKRTLLDTTYEKPISLSEENISNSEKMKELKELYNQGYITEEDYDYKLGELRGDRNAVLPQSDSLPKDIANDEKAKELKELYHQGFIAEKDYKFKLEEIVKAKGEGITSKDVPQERNIENEKLLELEEMKKEGIISDEDYAYKKAQILNK
ncbi:MAG TPA: SHOCT domain-containing protein [Candidatus Wujingus californicus]|uniref:SHOCT domain-containing protein n=1 Tax=Candidatus Wujingus californicus TaxID=3367618 RepID=UPI0040290E2F